MREVLNPGDIFLPDGSTHLKWEHLNISVARIIRALSTFDIYQKMYNC